MSSATKTLTRLSHFLTTRPEIMPEIMLAQLCLCSVAFGSDDLLRAALTNLEYFTNNTTATEAGIMALVRNVPDTGFGRASQSYEAEIQGLAAPVFGHTSHLTGAAARFTADIEHTTKAELGISAHAITRNWGGTILAAIEAAWSKPVIHPHILETTS